MDSYDKFIALLNAADPNPVQFTTDNVTFSSPMPDDGGADWNTKVTIAALPDSGYVGVVDVFYNRIHLAELGNDVWLFADEPFSLETIVSILNTTRDAFLLVTDMDVSAIPQMNVGDMRTVVLSARSDSVGWVGTTTVSIMNGFPDLVQKFDTLLNVTLPSSGYLT